MFFIMLNWIMCYNGLNGRVVLSAPWIAVSLETPPPWHATIPEQGACPLRPKGARLIKRSKEQEKSNPGARSRNFSNRCSYIVFYLAERIWFKISCIIKVCLKLTLKKVQVAPPEMQPTFILFAGFSMSWMDWISSAVFFDINADIPENRNGID